MSTTTTESREMSDRPKPHEQAPTLRPPRLPYHPAIEQRFGVDKASWKALVEAIFPKATTVESVILALGYCRARKLDPFKRNVHIVPIWNIELKRYVDTIWPGIGEFRTTAFRTGQYAGRGETVWGPDVTRRVGKVEMTFPEWAQVTVRRLVNGHVVDFCGPRVYWLETYAESRHDDPTPNSMWSGRPRGQLDKCAEAAALRAAFPEECGCEYIPEEAQHGQQDAADITPRVETLDDLAQRLTAPPDKSTGAAEPPRDEPEPERKPQDEYREPERTPVAIDSKSFAAAFAACQSMGAVTECAERLLAECEDADSRAAVEAMAEAARERVRAAAQRKRDGRKGQLFEPGHPTAQEAGV